ncbi:FHA domain-containing protein [Streptomyces sp. NPDC059788]|uniref:FHA domain-containing protein n=1 Tax=Streptomyces sp. NPDC059788 TaxID=3346948 RepID=UPI003657EE70
MGQGPGPAPAPGPHGSQGGQASHGSQGGQGGYGFPPPASGPNTPAPPPPQAHGPGAGQSGHPGQPMPPGPQSQPGQPGPHSQPGQQGQPELCPQCRTPREAMAPFCEECRYNFQTHSATSYAPPPPAPQGGPGPQGGQGGYGFPPPQQGPHTPPQQYEYQGSRPSQINRPAEPLSSEQSGQFGQPVHGGQPGPYEPQQPPQQPPGQQPGSHGAPVGQPGPLPSPPARSTDDDWPLPPPSAQTPPPPPAQPGPQGGPDHSQGGQGGQGGYGFPPPQQGPHTPPQQQGPYEPQQPGPFEAQQPGPFEPQQQAPYDPQSAQQAPPQAPFEPQQQPGPFGQPPQQQPEPHQQPQPDQQWHQPAPGPAAPPGPPPVVGDGWVVAIAPDREYFMAMMGRSGPEAAGLNLPAYSPEQQIPLTGPQITIGRRRHSTGESPDIDLGRPPEDPGVSHQHALLVQQPDGSWAVVDQNSTNGTTVNLAEDPIQPYVPTPLHEGDRIHVGAWTTITVRRA